MPSKKPIVSSVVTDITVKSVVSLPLIESLIDDVDIYLRPAPNSGFQYLRASGEGSYVRPEIISYYTLGGEYITQPDGSSLYIVNS